MDNLREVPPPPDTSKDQLIEKLRAENAALKTELELVKGDLRNGKLDAELEAEVKRRMALGLGYEDALECGRRQLKHDARLRENEAKVKAAAIQPS
jgi:hypothetical protein